VRGSEANGDRVFARDGSHGLDDLGGPPACWSRRPTTDHVSRHLALLTPYLLLHRHISLPYTGAVALRWVWPRETWLGPVPLSDDVGEFGERGRDEPTGAGIDAEFVVASANVLHQRMTAHDHPR
jgi:hypothetical protein